MPNAATICCQAVHFGRLHHVPDLGTMRLLVDQPTPPEWRDERCNPKATHAAPGEILHLVVRSGRESVHDAYTGENTLVLPHGIEHVRIVETVEAHLDKHGAR